MRSVTALFFTVFFLALSMTFPPEGRSEMEELVSRFQSEYDRLEPPPNSSVHGDFKLERVMVGSAYTVRGLKVLYDQNRRIEEKYDEMLEKYDEILAQNREMIELLKVIADGQRKGSE